MADETSAGGPREEDIINILVATDCHLGYKEKDAIRSQDSFVAFEEILQLAQKNKVDFILLGGDLFHENKPSRKTLHQCISLLRKYCMGNQPCPLEFLSDQSINFGHCKFPTVNYEDPNLNISYPVFSVHGNHDDPTGESHLSAIDLVSAAGLLNHFGRPQAVDKIEINPLLMRKGETKLSLYGLGAIRDERLYNTFVKKKVTMLRPEDDEDSWFSIFVIHQNRAKHGAKNHIPESFLDEFLDLVIWGHEHECLIEPEWSESSKPFYVSQPGSSVATSLSEGESKPKHVGLLQIYKKSFKMTKLPLKTVRQMFVEEIVLSDSLEPPSKENIISDFLEAKVDQILTKAAAEHSGDPKQPELPLVRLKIDHSDGFVTVSSQRFGQKFVDRVANCKDILLFNKKKMLHAKESSDNKRLQRMLASVGDVVQLEDILLQDDSLQFDVLSEKRMLRALREFIDKDEPDAISDLVRWQLRQTQNDLFQRNAMVDDLEDEIKKVKTRHCVAADAEQENQEIEKALEEARILRGDPENDPDNDSNSHDEAATSSSKAPPSKARGRGRGRGSSQRGTSTRGRGRGKGKANKQGSSSIMDSFMATGDKNHGVIEDSDEDGSIQQKNKPISATKSRSNRSTKQSSNIIQLSDDNSDDGADSMNIWSGQTKKRPKAN